MNVPALEATGLGAAYRKKPVLDGIDLAVHRGELTVLIGPNGSGKTTLLKTLGGLLPQSSGEIRLDGRKLNEYSRRERAARLAYLFQESGVPWSFTVEEYIAQGRFFRQGWFGGENAADKQAVRHAIEAAGLDGFVRRPVNEHSGGEYQRVLIARAVAQEAPCLLLDEPAANLDLGYRYRIMELLVSLAKEQGRAVLASLHELGLARLYADKIIVLCKGRIAARGSPEQTLTDGVLKTVFELPEAVRVEFLTRG
ncbi:MAG: ABC transporter ATP-binding protein [Spirochaetaceae bacterium]|jgi:iron complex transport system ATP-binding protein|nr:ABC transporter ATP-binding protein [Spirochaetaceae bacterium]